MQAWKLCSQHFARPKMLPRYQLIINRLCAFAWSQAGVLHGCAISDFWRTTVQYAQDLLAQNEIPSPFFCMCLYSYLLVFNKVSWLSKFFCMSYAPLCVNSTRISPEKHMFLPGPRSALHQFSCFCLDEWLMLIMHSTKKKWCNLGR